MAAPNDNNRALERSKVDLDPLSALLSVPPPAPDAEVVTPAPASAPAAPSAPAPVAVAPVADATPRRPSQQEHPSFPYPPSSSTPRSTTAPAPSPPQPQPPQPQPPQPSQRGSPPLAPHKPPGRPQPQALTNPFLATSRGAGAGVGGGPGAGDAMRQVGDVLNNLGSFLSSGLDSLSLSLGGANTNNPNGTSPPPLPPPHQAQSPHAQHAGHPVGSPSPFTAAALASSSPSPTPTPTVQRGAGASENGTEDPAAGFPLLSGEQRLASLHNFLLQTVHGVAVPGQLLITTYQVAFLPSPSRPPPPQLAHLPPSFFRLPMAAIDRTEREVRASGQGTGPPSVALVLHTKDGRVLRLLPAQESAPAGASSSLSTSPTAPPPPQSPSSLQQQQEVGLERVKGLVDAYAFPNDREGPAARHLFCFAHHKALLAQGSTLAAPPHAHHEPSLLEAEYARQFRRSEGGVWLVSEGCPWRLSAANAGHRLCASYPAMLVVPRLASDEELAASAAFRSEQRLPALTWGSSAHSGSLWRSSQPRVGMAGASSPEDERVLRLIGAGLLGLGQQGNGRPQQPGQGILRIMDLRNKTAAMANRATGHGYESSANYPTSVLTFCNIGNIHAMREAGQRLTQLCQSLAVQDAEWGALVEGTKWLTHLRLVLNAAYRAAHCVAREEASVLLHCSHGWDRTSQVAALAQLILDPYYRTFDGFAVLVEKDFGAFGHPFQLRTAHGLDRNARNEEQLAPIFLQFLDGVHQLLAQHPALFEFTGRYLLALADHLHDCRFGTFLCNTPKERAGPPVCTPAGSAATASVWTYLAHPSVRARLRNPLYDPTNSSKHAHPQRILDTPLPALLRRVALWGDYWLRWAAKPCHPPEAYAGVRRARETEAAAARAGGKGGVNNADVAVAWAWLEEEAEGALLLSSMGLPQQQQQQQEEQEGDLTDLASAPAPPVVAASKPEVVVAAAVAAPRQEASEVGEEGFVDLVDSAGVVVGGGGDGGEEEEGAEIASEFM